MTDEAAVAFQRGSVLNLAGVPAEIGALTLEAYGWAAGLLRSVVAVNAQRAAREADQVRWLRPLYQRSRLAGAVVAGPEQAGDLCGYAAAASARQASWPRYPRARVLTIEGPPVQAGPPNEPDGNPEGGPGKKHRHGGGG